MIGLNFDSKHNKEDMDPLAQYHPSNANSTHIGRNDLVLKTAVHALRNLPGAASVIQKINPHNTRPVTQIQPPPYNNDQKLQFIQH